MKETEARTFDIGQLFELQREAEEHWVKVKTIYEECGLLDQLWYPDWPTIDEGGAE